MSENSYTHPRPTNTSETSSSSTSGENDSGNDKKINWDGEIIAILSLSLLAVVVIYLKFANVENTIWAWSFLAPALVAIGLINKNQKINSLPLLKKFLILVVIGAVIYISVQTIGYEKVRETISWGDKEKQTQQASVRPAPRQWKQQTSSHKKLGVGEHCFTLSPGGQTPWLSIMGGTMYDIEVNDGGWAIYYKDGEMLEFRDGEFKEFPRKPAPTIRFTSRHTSQQLFIIKIKKI